MTDSAGPEAMFRNSDRRAPELPAAALGMPPRTVASPGASSVCAAAFTEIASRFFHQPIELPGSSILLDLLVPLVGIVFRKPRTERGEFLGTETLHRLFHLKDVVRHGLNLPPACSNLNQT